MNSNANNTTNPEVPPPAGAVSVGEWLLDGGNARHFAGTVREVDLARGEIATVKIAGDQFAAGHVDRYAIVERRLPALSAAEARQLARTLMAAADELDRLSDADGMIGS